MPFVRNNLFFVHIPKTGGRTIQRYFGFDSDPDLMIDLSGTITDHSSVPELLELGLLTKEQVEKSKIFTIVRNPYARAVSTYFFQLKHFQISKVYDELSLSNEEIYKKPKEKKNISFDEFCEFIVKDCGRWNIISERFDNMFTPQAEMIEYVDTILNFNNPDKVYQEIAKMVGSSHREFEKINSTEHEHYSRYYSEFSKKIIKEKYEKDLELFKFEFEEE